MRRLTSHMRRLTSHMRRLTNHMRRLNSHMRRLTCHMRRLTSHTRRLISHMRRLTSHIRRLTSHMRQLVNGKVGHQTVVVANIYRPPTTSKPAFLEEFDDLLSSLSLHAGNRLLICGDFNLPGRRDGTVDNDFLALLDRHNMKQFVDKVTRRSTLRAEHPGEHPRLGHRPGDFNADNSGIGGRLASPVRPSPRCVRPQTRPRESTTTDPSGTEHQSCQPC